MNRLEKTDALIKFCAIPRSSSEMMPNIILTIKKSQSMPAYGIAITSNISLFLSGRLAGSYGIIWNEDLDLEVETVYEDGVIVSQDGVIVSQDGVIVSQDGVIPPP